ncbi:MAG TPA: hypothetical protein VI358_01180, partial [Pseudolabrys sp.]
DTFIYYATASIRLFGRSSKFRLALGAACIIAACFAATLWASRSSRAVTSPNTGPLLTGPVGLLGPE